jgi:hypothetical protein
MSRVRVRRPATQPWKVTQRPGQARQQVTDRATGQVAGAVVKTHLGLKVYGFRAYGPGGADLGVHASQAVAAFRVHHEWKHQQEEAPAA